jgi:hypothetical protein
MVTPEDGNWKSENGIVNAVRWLRVNFSTEETGSIETAKQKWTEAIRWPLQKTPLRQGSEQAEIPRFARNDKVW